MVPASIQCLVYLKLTYRFHFSTKFLTSANKEAIYCTLAREMVVYSLPADHSKLKKTTHCISGVQYAGDKSRLDRFWDRW